MEVKVHLVRRNLQYSAGRETTCRRVGNINLYHLATLCTYKLRADSFSQIITTAAIARPYSLVWQMNKVTISIKCFTGNFQSCAIATDIISKYLLPLISYTHKRLLQQQLYYMYHKEYNKMMKVLYVDNLITRNLSCRNFN